MTNKNIYMVCNQDGGRVKFGGFTFSNGEVEFSGCVVFNLRRDVVESVGEYYLRRMEC